MQIWVIRHAVAKRNLENRHQGQTPDDPGLSKEGELQIQKIAKYVRDLHLCEIFYSPLPRARDTALAIAEAHSTPVLTFFDDDLKEITNGPQVDGMLVSDIQQIFPEGWKKWLATVADEPCFPGGESLNGAAARFIRALYRSARFNSCEECNGNNRGIKIIVSHGAVIKSGLSVIGGWDIKEFFPKLLLRNGSISMLDWDDIGFKIQAINMTGHLEDADFTPKIVI